MNVQLTKKLYLHEYKVDGVRADWFCYFSYAYKRVVPLSAVNLNYHVMELNKLITIMRLF